MTLTVDDLIDHLNSDDDEFEFVDGCFKRATSYVDYMLAVDEGQYTGKRLELFNQSRDQAILEVATNFYIHRDGATKANYANSSSLDTLIGFLRNPSL